MAKKKKLTHGQQRRVRSNQKKRIERHQKEIVWDESLLEAPRQGLVISRFGQHADIEDSENQTIHRCNLRRSVESLVCGDRVIWRPGQENLQGIAGVVEAVYERKTVLTGLDY